MQTTIQPAGTFKSTDSLILLLDDNATIPKGILSDEENSYVKKEAKAGRKSVTINQYKRVVIVYQLDTTKKDYALLEICRKAGDGFGSVLNKYKITRVVISDQSGHPGSALAVAEGIALGNYQFLKYRSKGKKEEQFTLNEIGIKSRFVHEKEISRLNHLVDAVYRTRTLVNEPQNWLTASKLGAEFVRFGKDAGFKVEVLKKGRIKALKMGGILAVNRGSVEPPTFTVMEYKPRNAINKKPYVLVGKGVVYDTGGLSLKPTPNSMDYMKCDMAGGALVGGTLYAIAKAKLPVHVIGLVPATDNRPGGDAYTPGDVITMMSGQTVEVLNTDAEGRMVLADALHYAKKYKPELVMDFATLTGAAAVAVGSFGIVCMGTASPEVKLGLKESGERVYERLAEFPFWDEYDDLIKSDIADMKNIGGPVAGAITAGKFLQRYIDYPWMHFDIAGPAYLHAPSSYRGKNGTGYGVRLMFDFFASLG